MGTHDKPIRKIEYCAAVNAILTGGWDAAVKLWDPRTPTCVGSYLQPDVVLALSVCGDKFVVGTAKRKVCIWDLRNMAGMFQRRESSLKYQTRCIKGFPNEQVCLAANVVHNCYTIPSVSVICNKPCITFFLLFTSRDMY
jgi:cell cycle arrest protein BUB3